MSIGIYTFRSSYEMVKTAFSHPILFLSTVFCMFRICMFRREGCRSDRASYSKELFVVFLLVHQRDQLCDDYEEIIKYTRSTQVIFLEFCP